MDMTPNQERKRRSTGCKQPDSTSAELRPVYGAYLNMARMNLYATLRHIAQLTNLIDKNSDEQNMTQMRVAGFVTKAKPEQRAKVRRELLKHIPVLKSMSSAYLIKKDSKSSSTKSKMVVEDKDIEELLQNIINVINNLRNFYTHAEPHNGKAKWDEQKEIEVKLLEPLDMAFDAAKREVETTFGYSKAVLKFIEGSERVIVTGKNADKKVIYHTDYYFRLRNKDDSALSHAGVAFLVSKFLQKKYATQFLQQTRLFLPRGKGGSNPFNETESKVMFNMFCAERIRLPKGRIESLSNASALGLDMLNELQKCPAELFQTFCNDDKKLFEVSHAKNDVSIEEDINLMRRNGDRFPTLALRYIDTQRVLHQMSFQVALGSYRYQFYNRASLDTVEKDRVRIIQKEINGFGRLPEIEEKRKEQYGNLIRSYNEISQDTAQTRPYMTDRHATYAITANRIGLIWSEGKRVMLGNDPCFLPKLPEPKQTSDGNWTVDRDELKSAPNMAPLCWLSTFDLPALVFLHLLGGKPSEVIREFHKNLCKLFDDIKNGERMPYFDSSQNHSKDELDEKLYADYRLHENQIPDRISDYLRGMSCGNPQQSEAAFNEWAEKKVLEMIERTERRRKHFENDKDKVGAKSNRIGKKNYVDIRPGALAQWLVRDIMAMQPADTDKKKTGGGKLTSMDYNVLQGAIATFKGGDFPLRETKLGEAFTKAKLVSDNPNKHPFLDKLMKKTIADTVGLYEEYLRVKKNWLYELKNTKGYRNAWFLRQGLKKNEANGESAIRDLASRYADTLQLPDGLFTEAIKERLAAIDNAALKEAIIGTNANNTAYLLKVWFKEMYGDENQPFYSEMDGKFKRNYKLFDKLKGEGTYLTDEDISRQLRKCDSSEAPIKKEISEHVKNLTITEHRVKRPATEEEKEAELGKTKRMLRECQENERIVRRYKNEDIVLFLMAKDLLLKLPDKMSSDSFGQFKLRNILPIGCNHDEENNMLNMQIPFSTTIELRDEYGKAIKRGDETIRKTIHKEKLKIKNYGDIYGLLYDPRIGRLLSQLDDDTFEHDKIEAELDRYDRSRCEIFAVMQKIERSIIKECGGFLNPDGTAQLADSGDPVRNKFNEIIKRCNSIDYGKAELLKDIRNAFGHNVYINKLERIIDRNKLEMPDIADLIRQWVAKQAL